MAILTCQKGVILLFLGAELKLNFFSIFEYIFFSGSENSVLFQDAKQIFSPDRQTIFKLWSFL
jgi:hypothetical protein